jgi:hypothetical protein
MLAPLFKVHITGGDAAARLAEAWTRKALIIRLGGGVLSLFHYSPSFHNYTGVSTQNNGGYFPPYHSAFSRYLQVEKSLKK